MHEIKTILKTLSATAGGWLGYFLGGFDSLLRALVYFAVADCITGVLRAVYGQQLNSRSCFKGMAKKSLVFVLVGVSHIFDLYVIGDGSVTRTATIFFYLACEGISILENSAALGLPMPDKLKSALNGVRGVGR